MPVTWNRKKDRLTGSAARVAKAVTDTFRAQAPAVQDRVNQRTPVDTGNLRSKNMVTANALRMEGKNEEDYALYVHEGHHSVMGRPYMRDGFEESVPVLEGQLKTVIERELG